MIAFGEIECYIKTIKSALIYMKLKDFGVLLVELSTQTRKG